MAQYFNSVLNGGQTGTDEPEAGDINPNVLEIEYWEEEQSRDGKQKWKTEEI